MFSENQIKNMAKSVADTEIEIAEIEVSQLKGQLQSGNDNGIVIIQDDGTPTLLESSTSDAGKVVGVKNSGDLGLVEVSAGAKIYKHVIKGLGTNVIILSTDATPYKDHSSKVAFLVDALSMHVGTKIVFDFGAGASNVLYYLDYVGSSITRQTITLDVSSITSEEVTEL